MNAVKYAINIDAFPKFKTKDNLLNRAFPPGHELDPIPPSKNGQWANPGKVFNPYGVFSRWFHYFRLRESVECNEKVSPGAKLAFSVLEYWWRYERHGRTLSPSRMSKSLGMSKWQAIRYVNELAFRGLIQIHPDRTFSLLDELRQRRDPVQWKEHGSIIPAEILCCRKLEMLDRLLYGRLARAAGRHGKTWKTHSELAASLGVEPRRIMDAIQRLERVGLLLVLRPGSRSGWYGVPHKGHGSRGSQNVYAFLGSPILEIKEPRKGEEESN